MLNNSIFYHQITRKVVVAFGSLFSNIRIDRKKEGESEQVIKVPIAYAPKEKWLVRIEQDPTLENHTYTTLPRLSFEITGLSYDPARKTNRMSKITCGDGEHVKSTYAPVPYNIDVTLYALTKTQEDGLQIVEQILPYFTPEYTLSIRAVEDSSIIVDVPIILNSVSVDDQYDGDFQTRRFITYTMNFTLKTYMFGPVSEGSLIRNTLVDLTNINLVNIALYDAQGLNDGSVIELWNELS